jgi:aspartate aminotransferase
LVLLSAYRNDDGKPWVLPMVKTVEEQMAADATLNHEYLPVSGLPLFRQLTCALVLGKDNPAIIENRVSPFSLFLSRVFISQKNAITCLFQKEM